MTNCTFTNNTANQYGGSAIHMGTGTVTNCNFAGNTATTDGGGAIHIGTGSVSNCNFINNTVTSEGGAIRFSSRGTVTNYSLYYQKSNNHLRELYFSLLLFTDVSMHADCLVVWIVVG